MISKNKRLMIIIGIVAIILMAFAIIASSVYFFVFMEDFTSTLDQSDVPFNY